MGFGSPAIGRGGAYVVIDTIRVGKWYSVKEVSEFLGFSTDTVIRQVRAGYIKAFTLPCKSSVRRRVYRCYRVQGAEIVRYVREHMSGS